MSDVSCDGDSIRITLPEYSVRFDRRGGGFPTWIGFTGRDGEEAVSTAEGPWLSVEVAVMPLKGKT